MIRLSCKDIGLAVLLSISTSIGQAQTETDTLRLSPVEAENLFLSNNLLLLAEKLNINQADARILQAKAWPNPTFTIDEIQVYKNATTDEIPPIVGNFWRDRNFAFQLEQLITTAGKRKKGIAIEKINKEKAETLLTDLLLALKAEFRQNIAELQYSQLVKESWIIQLIEVQKLLNAQSTQFKEGFISQAELFRLKALLVSLQGELNEIEEEINEKQKTLKTLMVAAPNSYIIVSGGLSSEIVTEIKHKSLSEIMARSANNANIKASEADVRISNATLSLERANRVPNLNLISNYDRNGSTMRNFVGVGLSVDLPIFNKNKGNIQAAQFEVKKTEYLQKEMQQQVSNAVVQLWTDLQQSVKLYESIDTDYIARLDELTVAITRNFSGKNISLLEFLDFYESFRDSKEKYFSAIKNITLKKEELAYLIGGEL